MQLVDWLDDLCVRFIINLPQEELESVERICFQVEEAQWYYEDFIRPLDPDLPSLNLRNFCLRIFQHCPLLSQFSPDHHAAAFEEFLAYKTRVPVRGAIMLNYEMDEVVLVKGWKKNANWSFPRGKINKDELDLDCAVREVYEETGYDIQAAGLVRSPETMKYIDVAIQHQHIRLYVFRGVPPDTLFEARTRKEISKIEWWKLSDLPTLKKKKQQQEGRGEDLATNANKFYMVAPFLVPLKKWISHQKKLGKATYTDELQPNDDEIEDVPTASNGPDGVDTLPTPDDMERLLAGLRQPAKAPATSDVRIHNPVSPADEASLHLKQLLRVPTGSRAEAGAHKPPATPAEPASVSAEAKKASTLLALLKGGSSAQRASTPAPQTPMEQMIAPLSAPESPKPHHPVPSRRPTLPPPPIFPLSPQNHTHVSSSQLSHLAQMPKASVAAWNDFSTTAAEQEATARQALAAERAARLDEQKRSGVQHELTLPTMKETWRQVRSDKNANMREAGQRQVTNVVQRSVGGPQLPRQHHVDQVGRQKASPNNVSSSAPAPYEATTTGPVTTNRQYPDIYRPTIPAANKLPMPKLNPHSSSLLNLFKGTQATHEESNPLISKTDQMSRPPAEMAKGKQQATHELKSSTAPQPASSTTRNTTEAKKPQSAHQAALLDLFRRPSLPAAETTPSPKATSNVLAGLVELSAMPSPDHSREPSKADVEGAPKLRSSISGKPALSQKRPEVNVKRGQPPVFATVSGPLNIPHFETIASRARESAQKAAVTKDIKRSPVTILARPAKSKPRNSVEHTGEPVANGTGSGIPPPIGLNHEITQPQSSKQFQPQILRRPPQAETSATGFTRPNVANPFAPSVHTRSTPEISGDQSGNTSRLPQRSRPDPNLPSNLPLSEMMTPSYRMKEEDLPGAFKEKDPQSSSVTHAPSNWGQPDPPQPQQQSKSQTFPARHNIPHEPSTLTTATENRDVPSPLSASDRGAPVKPNHRATLLSLFTKPASQLPSPVASTRPDFSAFVSPVAAHPPTTFPPYVSRDEPQKSTAGDFTGPANGTPLGGTGAGGGAGQMPKKKTTSDIDRTFLLGYLEGVVRKEGR
ncbi:MAG: hypothetical protein LQ346_004874 [Caloplaca aetnensis]|nr:MAG: hypothetical protein LQ346_004874 [Caloplaca aetnensis]